MVYPAVTPAELHKRQLEVTVWHHQYDGTLEFLGEFLLDLTGTSHFFFFTFMKWCLDLLVLRFVSDPGATDEQPHWYWLQDNSGGLASLPMGPELNGDPHQNGDYWSNSYWIYSNSYQ